MECRVDPGDSVRGGRDNIGGVYLQTVKVPSRSYPP